MFLFESQIFLPGFYSKITHRYLKNDEECSCSAIHNKNLNQSRNK